MWSCGSGGGCKLGGIGGGGERVLRVLAAVVADKGRGSVIVVSGGTTIMLAKFEREIEYQIPKKRGPKPISPCVLWLFRFRGLGGVCSTAVGTALI